MDLEIVCENEKYLPTYATENDACMDIKIRIPEGENGLIAPYTIKTFGTGIQVKVPVDSVMQIYPRSSLGFKQHCMLANTTGIIDTGYRDEIKIALYNFGDKAVEFTDGQRVAQAMILQRPKLNLIQVKDNEEFRTGDRGGGIGSTGK